MTEKKKTPCWIYFGRVDDNASRAVWLQADGEIKPGQMVVPSKKKEGTVRALRDDEPVIINGRLNPKIVGRIPWWEGQTAEGEAVRVNIDSRV